jgi:DNA polymerase I-like protein with 3'-5' exonuclease and polymerase domains
MLHRCSEDAVINALVYRELKRETIELPVDVTQALQLEHDIAKIITQQEINGVPFDLDNATNLMAELQVGILDIDEELVPTIPEVPLSKSRQPKWPSKQFKKDGSPTVAALRYYGDDFSRYSTDIIVKTEPINLGSDKQVKNYLLSIGWVPTEWNFKKDPITNKPIRDMRGNKVQTSPKLTEDSYDSLDSDIGKTISHRLKMAHRKALVSGLIDRVRPDGKLTASAIPMGTPTGRMVHRGVVNIPGGDSYLGKELRSLFGTEQGMIRVGIDQVNCQLRALGHYMGDPVFIEALLSGTQEEDNDSHCLGRDMAGLQTRAQGKKFIYSTLFGAGSEKLAADLGISVTEAKIATEKFFANMPHLQALVDNLKKQWKAVGFIKGLDNRPLWVRSEHMLLVYLMQSLEAIVMKEFIVGLGTLVKHRSLTYKIVTTMHDEVQYLVKPDDVGLFRRAAHMVIDQINAKYRLQCPQAIDIRVGKTWQECH